MVSGERERGSLFQVVWRMKDGLKLRMVDLPKTKCTVNQQEHTNVN